MKCVIDKRKEEKKKTNQENGYQLFYAVSSKCFYRKKNRIYLYVLQGKKRKIALSCRKTHVNDYGQDQCVIKRDAYVCVTHMRFIIFKSINYAVVLPLKLCKSGLQLSKLLKVI